MSCTNQSKEEDCHDSQYMVTTLLDNFKSDCSLTENFNIKKGENKSIRIT